jgi:hypothetical protein
VGFSHPLLGFAMDKDDNDLKRQIDRIPNKQLTIPTMDNIPISFDEFERRCEAFSEGLEKKIPREE